MNKKEATQILAILKAAYPNFYKDMKPEEAQGTVSVWQMQFSDYPAEILLMALNKAISVSKFPPSIAEVKEKFSSIHWETYEVLNRHYNIKNLTDEEFAYYKRIYELTQPYKHTKKLEPSIKQMLPSSVKQLKE